MHIIQRQISEIESQLPKLVRHWKRIAQEIGRDGSRIPSSLDDFSREEAGRILDFLVTVHLLREIRHQDSPMASDA